MKSNHKPNIVVRNENVSIAMWLNTSKTGGKYMTFVISKFHKSGMDIVTDVIKCDRKELGKFIWIFDKMNDKVNAL